MLYFCTTNDLTDMKKIALVALAALMLGACQQKETFTVKGTISEAEGQLLCLRNIALSGNVNMIDSVRLDADGDFSFTADATDAPEFYILDINNQFINLAIDSTETVTIKAALPTMAKAYEVEGSDDCQKIKELSLQMMELEKQARALDEKLGIDAQAKADLVQVLVNEYKANVLENYIYKAPNKAFAYFALFQRLFGQWPIFNPTDRNDLKAYGAVATSWDTFYPEALRTVNLRNITLKTMDDNRIIDARQQQTIDENLIVESGVIELRLPDCHDQLRTLTELKGKVVLLDFHSFTARESAERILLLRELYNKYHAQGLEIYQVGIGDEQHLWRMATDALPWISVYDPLGQSLPSYNVQSIPEFFLIDRDNQLQKRSSQMTDLEAEIKALL